MQNMGEDVFSKKQLAVMLVLPWTIFSVLLYKIVPCECDCPTPTPEELLPMKPGRWGGFLYNDTNTNCTYENVTFTFPMGMNFRPHLELRTCPENYCYGPYIIGSIALGGLATLFFYARVVPFILFGIPLIILKIIEGSLWIREKIINEIDMMLSLLTIGLNTLGKYTKTDDVCRNFASDSALSVSVIQSFIMLLKIRNSYHRVQNASENEIQELDKKELSQALQRNGKAQIFILSLSSLGAILMWVNPNSGSCTAGNFIMLAASVFTVLNATHNKKIIAHAFFSGRQVSHSVNNRSTAVTTLNREI